MIDISRESEINLINILIDQDIISGKDLLDIKKASADGEKSQLDAVFELKITDEDKILDLLSKRAVFASCKFKRSSSCSRNKINSSIELHKNEFYRTI